jgi:hypothetical protein
LRKAPSRASIRNRIEEHYQSICLKKNVVFWDIKNLARTSQKTHYVSATESSQLMLCKI